MCLTEDDGDNDRGNNNRNTQSPLLLLPDHLEHEVPSVSLSRGNGWVILEDGDDQETIGSDTMKNNVKMFVIVFGLIFFGATNNVSAKLQTIPM